MNESAADWGLVFDTLLLLIAFLQSDAETPETAAGNSAFRRDTARRRTGFSSGGITSVTSAGCHWRPRKWRLTDTET